MKFTALLSTLLAALAVASPVSFRDPAIPAEETALTLRLFARDDPPPPVIQESDNWKRATAVAKAAQVNLAANTYHYFLVEWPRGTSPPPESKETSAEIKKLQEKLGFDHIAVVAGIVEETTTVSKVTKNNPVAITTIKRDFRAQMYDLIKMTSGKVDTRSPFWDASRDVKKNVKYGGATTKAKVGKVKKASDDFKKENPDYKVDSVNCATYKDAIVKVLK
ncbi:hypothetical protein B0T16DRAFT_514669 [Cercophora newfieldiana]|uniref:Uncharacterized protein n=1 Tax=Cercophora newfieldiana TaxID=92897 RepID=A0AA40CJ16_9PEZI|nr:hypothetical protein B0T16DRAFT_514669 [Cercophora newfieldiana]